MISQQKLCRSERTGKKYQTDEKQRQPRLLYSAKLLFKIKGHIKSFPDKKKLKEFIIIKPVLHEMLKGLLQKEGKKDKIYE